MAAQAGVAGVYVAGFALVAGAVWLTTPPGRRAYETLGEAVYEGGAQAIDNITDLFSRDKVETKSTPITTATTNDTTRRCEGPHRGRLQVQGYDHRKDPLPIELSWPWERKCVPLS